MGNILGWIAPTSQLSEQFPPTSKFDPARDIPDLTGKITIVTGGNSGIGYHVVKQLLLKNATVYLAARSPSKCEEAAKRLKDETGGKEPIFLQLDLADLNSIKSAAKEFLSKEERLDILVNNAGTMVPTFDELTVQGYDLRTNTLGPYFFTLQLLPALERSTTHHKNKARVVHTSSTVHTLSPGQTGIDWKTVKGGAERDKAVKKLGMMAKWNLYGASKIATILVSHIFTKYHGDVVTSCAVHPGGIVTELQKNMSASARWITHQVSHPASMGAWTTLWAGTTANAEEVSGKYLIPWARVGKADPRAANEATRDELKKWMDEELKDY